jgi:hypothetical protein
LAIVGIMILRLIALSAPKNGGILTHFRANHPFGNEALAVRTSSWRGGV